MKNINSQEFAEICGIHAGDGWLSTSINEIGFGTSKNEPLYFSYVKQRYSKVFHITISRVLHRPKYNSIEFRIQSKNIQKIFVDAGFSRGSKLDNLKAPSFIFSKQSYMKQFLRGLMDTDGTVYWRNNGNDYYLQITFNTTSYLLIKDILEILKILDFKPTYSATEGKNTKKGNKRRIMYRAVIQKKKDVLKYINIIGFRNEIKIAKILLRKEDLEDRYGPARI